MRYGVTDFAAYLEWDPHLDIECSLRGGERLIVTLNPDAGECLHSGRECSVPLKDNSAGSATFFSVACATASTTSPSSVSTRTVPDSFSRRGLEGISSDRQCAGTELKRKAGSTWSKRH